MILGNNLKLKIANIVELNPICISKNYGIITSLTNLYIPSHIQESSFV